MRTDPTENGGLFIGRRPGTRPVKYREEPRIAGVRRRTVDNVLAGAVLLLMMLICLSFWGPLPAAWFWIGGHIPGAGDSPSVPILVIFAGLMTCLLLALVACKRLDAAWILLRRAAGHDQREGMIGKVFGFTCAVGAIIFTGWLLLFSGAHLSGGGVGL
jgi:hypothetical protein